MRRAQVRIDQQGLLAELGKDHGQVGGKDGCAIVRIDTHHHQRLVAACEPAQHQLAADGAQGFDLLAKWLVRGKQLVRKVAGAARQVGIIELAREYLLDIGFGDQAQALRRFTKTDAQFLLHAQHAFGIFRRDLARLQQQAADAGIANVRRVGGRCWYMPSQCRMIHCVSYRINSNASGSTTPTSGT